MWDYNFLKQGFPEFFICYRPVSETMYCKVTFTRMVANLGLCAKYSHWDISCKSQTYVPSLPYLAYLTEPWQRQPLEGFLAQCLWVCVSHWDWPHAGSHREDTSACGTHVCCAIGFVAGWANWPFHYLPDCTLNPLMGGGKDFCLTSVFLH